ncbi:hypothetical protein [Streptomyces griseorubiginosus]|uniref:hypothetical protein n=1 Tax=Streptomyces griseorubiginosus TaxID=67304 RepID=UPI0036E1BFEA
MTAHGQNQGQPALRPALLDTGALVHTTADRRLATQHWLLSTCSPAGRDRARMEWQEHGVAMLPLGTLFSAVRLPGALVQALAASSDPEDIDAFLEEALKGGPVICDVSGRRYYALVPASVPRTYKQAIDEEWRPNDVEVLGRESYMGVPPVDAVEHQPHASYWSVPMASAAELCGALDVARLIAAGVDRLAELEQTDTHARLQSVTTLTAPRRRPTR